MSGVVGGLRHLCYESLLTCETRVWKRVASTAGRPLRPNRQNLDSAIFSPSGFAEPLAAKNEPKITRPFTSQKCQIGEADVFVQVDERGDRHDPVRAVRDSDGASSDAREEDGIQPISRANGERLDGGALRQLRAPRVSSDAPLETLVPKTHHRPIPLRLKCSETPPSPVPRPLQAEGQQGGGHRGEILVRKTRSSERRDRSHRGRRRHR